MDGRRRMMRVIVALVGAALLAVAGPASAQAGQQQVPSGKAPASPNQTPPSTPTTTSTTSTTSGGPLAAGSGASKPGEPLAASASLGQASYVAAADDDQKEQRPAARWTQFGARLRPLASGQPVDHAGSASNKAYAHQSRQAAAGPTSDEEEADEELGQAMLLKMMRQQGFLGAPAGGPAAGQPKSAPNDEQGNGRRVIRLLKSYSHIHQVDDSDDQIRGAWRPAAADRRQASARANANANSNKWRQQQQQDGNNRANHHQPEENQAEENQDSASPQPPGAQQEEDEFECPNNGIFADEPSGCQYYHVCQSGAQVQQKFQCPMGTLFNNVILTCDFAHNVQCSKQARRREQQQQQQQQQSEAPRVAPVQPQRPWQRPQQRLPGSEPVGSTSYQVQRRPRPNPGPRPLQIGPGAASASDNRLDSSAHEQQDNNDDDEPDSDAPGPLVPARLPYSPPPTPELAQPARDYQQRPLYLKSPLADYSDGGSVSAPVHAGPPASGLRQPSPVASSTAPTVATTPASSSFNLMIDHQVGGSPKLTSAYKPALSSAAVQAPAPRQQQQPQKRPSVAPKPRAEPTGPKYGAKRQQLPSAAQKPNQSRQQLQPHGPSYLASSSQQRPYQQHTPVTQQQQRQQPRPALVDLTNSQHGPSVASSALQNDGLLLLLRHSNAGYHQAQASGQAYALDPQLVRPNPIDAHLFPNVQSALGHGARVAASSQPTPVRMAPPAQPQPQSRQTHHQASAKHSSPNLPPMEPPKPQELVVSSKGVSINQKASTNEELQFQAAASAPARHAQTVAPPPAPEKKKSPKTGSSSTKPTPTTTSTTTTVTTPTAKPAKRAIQSNKRIVKRTKLVEKLPPPKRADNKSTTASPSSTLATTTTRQQQLVKANSR